jgi:hypothetical protein
MRDRPVIYCGLLIFAGLFTFPIWHGLAAHTTTKGPQQAIPAHEKECVAPVELMKRSHMQLLHDLRDKAVRGGDRTLKTYHLNLTSTCLTECHAGKADFCDRCHSYAGVAPSCWNCHLDSKPGLLPYGRGSEALSGRPKAYSNGCCAAGQTTKNDGLPDDSALSGTRMATR